MPVPVPVPVPEPVNPRSSVWLSRTGSDLVVIGDSEHADGVCAALHRISSRVHHVASVESALGRRWGRVQAHVLVSPLPEAKLKDAIVRLRFAGPVFVVVPEGFSDQRARGLYDAGSWAVFEWPSEALLLPRMLQERLRLTARRGGPATDGDEALARSIHTRLELARFSSPALEVDVDDGIVHVRGKVDSVWNKERVARTIEHVPGVKAVIAVGIRVVPPHRSDVDIERDIRGVMEIMLSESTRTVSFSVNDGAVVLVGNVPERDQLERLLSFVGNVRGVKVIRNLVTVSASASRRDRGLTRRLCTALRGLYPDCALEVTCFGSVVVVSGRVPRLSTKREIEQLVNRQEGIERVVNKIEIGTK
ncbi:MAG: BON domain-containing protein [Myxococcota bacterium]